MTGHSFILGLLDTTVAVATILLIASLGEIITERAGVVNLGIEGLLSVSAFLAFVTTAVSGSAYLGVIAGVLTGGIFASALAVTCISFKADQVVAGLMFSILGIGLTSYFTGEWGGENIQGLSDITIPSLSALPLIGPVLFQNTLTEFLGFLLVPVVWYLLFRSHFGLSILAVGDDPETADSRGISVARVRYLAVIVGGLFMGMAGAHISISYTNLWTEGLIGGRGWIVIALVIFARWRTVGAVFGSILFGVVEAVAVRAQGLTVTDYVSVNPTFDGMLLVLTDPNILEVYPYVITIVSLVFISIYEYKETAAPDALMQQYYRE